MTSNQIFTEILSGMEIPMIDICKIQFRDIAKLKLIKETLESETRKINISKFRCPNSKDRD